jgi:2-aminoadipate transaminase
MPPTVSWTRPSGGFFLWLTAGEGTDTRALVAPAARLGVAYVPGAPFYTDGRGGNELRLAFSRADEPAIDEGIRRLATLLDQPGGQPLPPRPGPTVRIWDPSAIEGAP